jgi:hypothetical protein
MTLDDWLNLNDCRNLRRLAELMTVNHGRLKIEGNIGSVLHDQNVNRYGRLGLNIHEAFELQYYNGIVDALTNCEKHPQQAAKAAMDRLTREASGRVIELPTPEQRKMLLGGK